jgi:hypothetical protein
MLDEFKLSVWLPVLFYAASITRYEKDGWKNNTYVQKGGRRKAEGGSKNLRAKNFHNGFFMLNFLLMKTSCNDEFPVEKLMQC